MNFQEFVQDHLNVRYRGNIVHPPAAPDGTPNAMPDFVVHEVVVEPVQIKSLIGRDWRDLSRELAGNHSVQEAGRLFWDNIARPSGAFQVKLYGERDASGTPAHFLAFTSTDELPERSLPPKPEA